MSGRRFLGFIGCGVLLLLLTGFGLWLPRQDGIYAFVAVALMQGAVYLLALALIWRAPAASRDVGVILVVAAAMRIAVLLPPPFLSSDIYRYVWDGRVIAAGINPYRYIPTDPHLAGLRDAVIFPAINRANYAPTIYPPLAEAIFFAVTRISETVTAIKAAMVGFEAIAVLLLARLLAATGQPTTRIAVYAWHPLPLWEFAGSGHIDAALIAFVALALWARCRLAGQPTPSAGNTTFAIPGLGPGIHQKPLADGRTNSGHAPLGGSWLTGSALAGAVLVKFYPAVLFPALWRPLRHHRDWRMPAAFVAAVVLGYLPFLGVGWGVLGFLLNYLAEEGFTTGGAGFYLWHLAQALLPLGGVAFVAIAAALLALLVLIMAVIRTAGDVAAAALLAGAFMLLLSPHYPWYFAWLLIFPCLVPAASLLWLTLASFLLYLVPVGSQLVRDPHRSLIESIIYLPFLALAAIDVWRRRRRAEQRRHGEHAG